MPNPIIGQDKPTPPYDLFAKYPHIPRTIILKLDTLNLGLKYTPILNWIGKWTLSFGGLAGYETKPKELYDGTISQGSDPTGFYDLPAYFLFRDSTLCQVLIKDDSPYEIRYEGDGNYMLCWNGMAVEEVMFSKRPAWMSMTLSDGTPIGKTIMTTGDAVT